MQAPSFKNCPNTLNDFVPANNVGAYFTGTSTRTYFFNSFVDQNPVNGVPGLIAYCVYTDGEVTSANAALDTWREDFNGGNVSFARRFGNKANIPLDGVTGTEVGTATFTTEPDSQDILLHIADAPTCQVLYGGDATTCFVLPRRGPICDAGTGNTAAGYNAIPTDVEHCSPPSLGFEATQTNEFGDEVTLDTTGGTELLSMTVDFQSYGCSFSGHWNTGNCVTVPGSTFTIPASGGDPAGITASIYAPGDLTTPIATSTVDPNIPYRPSADDVNCPVGEGKWFDPISGACNYSLSVPITFPFPGTQTLPNTVVWTVKFNTSTEGYHPIGPCPNSDPGCGYDSLNVGAKSYPNAPYAGTDVDDNTAYRSYLGNSDVLAPELGWALYRPLGQIVLAP